MLPKLVSLAEFQQRAGMTIDEVHAAAFAGSLPASVGEVQGLPFWLEKDVAQFIGKLRADALIQTAFATPSPSPSPYTITSNAVPAVVSEPDAPAPLTVLEQALAAILPDVQSPYILAKMPAPLDQCVPHHLRSRIATLDESKARTDYSIYEIAEYFGVSAKSVDRVARDIALKGIGKRGRWVIFSHAQVMKLWKSQEWHASPTRGGHGQTILRVWIDELRDYVANRQAGAKLAPLNTPADAAALAPTDIQQALARGNYFLDSRGNPVAQAQPKARRGRPPKEKPAAAPVKAAEPEPERTQTVTVGEWKPGDWISERAVADHLGLSLEVVRIIRKDKIGPASAYRNGTLQYRFIDVESWRAANMPVIAHWKNANGDEWLDLQQAAAMLGIAVHNLQKICAPSYKGPNPGPASTIIERKLMFKRSNLIAWQTHHRHVIERIHRDSAQRGEHMRAIQKKAVESRRLQFQARQREAAGQPAPAVRLLDDKPVSDKGKKVFKRIQPAIDKLEQAQAAAREQPNMEALTQGKATLADVLVKTARR